MSVDYDRCLKMDLLPLWECIYYVLEKEPRLTDRMNSFGEISGFEKKFHKILEMASAAYQCGNLKFYPSGEPRFLDWNIIPTEFFNWVKNKVSTIPKELHCLLKEELSNVSNTALLKIDDTPVIESHKEKKEVSRVSQATMEEIYSSISLTDKRRKLLIKKIQDETPASREQRIYEDTQYYFAELKTNYPKNKVSIERTARMLHQLEKPIYEGLTKKSLSEDSYVTYERKIRNKKK